VNIFFSITARHGVSVSRGGFAPLSHIAACGFWIRRSIAVSKMELLPGRLRNRQLNDDSKTLRRRANASAAPARAVEDDDHDEDAPSPSTSALTSSLPRAVEREVRTGMQGFFSFYKKN
jgi:hypothetical protein